VVPDAVILAGGLATRLGDLAAATPKCLMPVAGRPFVDHLLWNLRRHGVRRVVFAIGRLGEQVESHVGDGSAFGLEAVYSREESAMGTGGALALAADHVTTDEVFILNGDSLFDVNYLDLALRLRAVAGDGARAVAPAGARAVIALREVADAARYGSVRLAGGRDVVPGAAAAAGDASAAGDAPAAGLAATPCIAVFDEKGLSGPGLVSGGVYCVETALLRELDPTPHSLETEVFPRLVVEGELNGAVYGGLFVDIGVPDSLDRAQAAVAAWRRRPVAFLDRDGVLNVDVDYLHKPEHVEWIPGAIEAVRELNDAGFLVIVATNQAGIGRGLYTEDDFEAFTSWMADRLAEAGAHIDAVYHCPHHPTEALPGWRVDCECRKPRPGMFIRALAEWDVDVERSFMVGDKPGDLQAARGAGIARGVLFTGGDLREAVRPLMG
jgi:D,D-heptose 1,7-bisphosphate phosphatase